MKRKKKDKQPKLVSYGGDGTLNQEDQLKVEVDLHGNVFGVSFRGQHLPFYWVMHNAYNASVGREKYQMYPPPRLHSVNFKATDDD